MHIVLVGGPTASGKSAFAFHLAERLNGCIVNADSVQMYKGLKVISASPSDSDKKHIRHYLYNFLEDQKFSVADYLRVIPKVIEEITEIGKLPIIVGGSGLYIDALLHGLHHVPKVCETVANSVAEEVKRFGVIALHKRLLRIDPQFASKISAQDCYRVSRAYSVFLQTGKTLSYFFNGPKLDPLSAYRKSPFILHPSRRCMRKMCDARSNKILSYQSELLEEVSNFLSARPHGSKLVKVIGMNAISEYLGGKISYEAACELFRSETRQYAKRQITWFKNRLVEKQELCFDSQGELEDLIEAHVRNILAKCTS